MDWILIIGIDVLVIGIGAYIIPFFCSFIYEIINALIDFWKYNC